MRKEIPDYDFPIIDPHQPGPIMLELKNRYLTGGRSNLTNVRTFGLSRARVRGVKSTFKGDGMKLNVELFFPKLLCTGNYSSLFAFNSLLTFRSEGIFRIAMTGLNEKFTIRGKLERREGEDYMKAYRIDVDPEANDIDIHFTGLTPDEKLSELITMLKILTFESFLPDEIALRFFKTYWRVFYKEHPSTHAFVEPVYLDIVNQIFSQIPFRRLLIQD